MTPVRITIAVTSLLPESTPQGKGHSVKRQCMTVYAPHNVNRIWRIRLKGRATIPEAHSLAATYELTKLERRDGGFRGYFRPST